MVGPFIAFPAVTNRVCRVPPNVIFEVDDCESEWPDRRGLDFIHSRYMAGSIQDWPRLIRQCYELSTHLFILFSLHLGESLAGDTVFVLQAPKLILCCLSS